MRTLRWVFVRKLMRRRETAGPAELRIHAWLVRHVPYLLTCADFEQFVHDYVEGSLDPRERRTFDLHMELCRTCQVYFAHYVETIDLGKAVCDAADAAASPDLPEELVAAILAARSAR